MSYIRCTVKADLCIIPSLKSWKINYVLLPSVLLSWAERGGSEISKCRWFSKKVGQGKKKKERTRVTAGDGGKDFTGRLLTLFFTDILVSLSTIIIILSLRV